MDKGLHSITFVGAGMTKTKMVFLYGHPLPIFIAFQLQGESRKSILGLKAGVCDIDK